MSGAPAVVLAPPPPLERGAVVLHPTSGRSSYVILGQAGRGGFGVVYEAERASDRARVAIKVIEERRLRAEGFPTAKVEEEIRVHAQLDHPNIVPLLDAFHDRERIFIITAFCGRGDLASQLERRCGMPFAEREAAAILAQVVDALSYLHRNGIMHRDLKLANVLLSDDGRCQLADFGLAKMELGGKRMVANVHQTLCGTPSSIAPEVASGAPYSNQVDLFGLGVIMYALLVGRQPFDDNGQLKGTIAKVKSFNPDLPSHLSANAVHLLNGLLQKNPSQRLTLSEVAGHAFFSSAAAYDSGIGGTTLSANVSKQTSRISSHNNTPEIRRPLSELTEEPNSRFRSLRSIGNEVSVQKAVKPTPQLKTRLTTARLESLSGPPRPLGPGIRGSLLETGQVLGEFELNVNVPGKKPILERITISGDGDTIRVEKSSLESGTIFGSQEYKYVTLPRSYYQKYNILASFVNITRLRVPKVTLFTPKAECHLMENLPNANCEVKFFDRGLEIKYDAATNQIIVKDTSTGETETFSYPLSNCILSTRPHLALFNELHSECKDHVDHIENGGRLHASFPAVFGHPPKLDVSHKAPVTSSRVLLRSTSTPLTTAAAASQKSSLSRNMLSAVASAKVNPSKYSSPSSKPPASTSSALSVRSVQHGGNTCYVLDDGTEIIVDARKRPTEFRYTDRSGLTLIRNLDQEMPEEMKSKVVRVTRYIQRNQTHRSSPR